LNSASPKYGAIGRHEMRSRHSHANVSDNCFCTGGVCWVIYTGHPLRIP
jgi:hypothetical protein